MSDARRPIAGAQRNALELAHQFIGWGEVRAGLWFVGLEEGGAFDSGHLKLLEASRDAFRAAHPEEPSLFWNEPRPVTDWEPSRTDLGEGSLCAALENQERGDYVPKQAWASKSFHCNLHALGYQRRRGAFPEGYAELFGLRSPRDPVLRGLEEHRHELLRELRSRRAPGSALVCLGLGNQAEFESALGLEGGVSRPAGRTRMIVYPACRAVVVHHCSWGEFHSGIPTLVKLLREEFGVVLRAPGGGDSRR